MIPASWLPLTAGARFTQHRQHSLADPCVLFLTIIFVMVDNSSVTNTFVRPTIVKNSIKIICAGSSFNNHSCSSKAATGSSDRIFLHFSHFRSSFVSLGAKGGSENSGTRKRASEGSGAEDGRKKWGNMRRPRSLNARRSLARSLALRTDGRSV